MDFNSILLEVDQQSLLVALVEASRKQPREERQRFARSSNFEMDEIIGLANYGRTYLGDIQALIDARLLRDSSSRHDTLLFDVSSLGYQYYELLMKRKGTATERVEQYVFRNLNAVSFEKRHPQAFAKWQQAEELLWGSDSQQQHTAIGHHCREAMQFFATSLVEKYQPPDVEQEITKTVKRLETVLKQTAEQMSDSIAAILEAMFQYWRTLNDLAQRQEHGAQKEGETLAWEDSRRLVFQTAIVMFEIDSMLKDLK